MNSAPLLPSKPKRSAGGFFSVFIGDKYLWISEEYHLYRRGGLSRRDEMELERNRRTFMESASTSRIEVDGLLYVMNFQCNLTDDQKLKVVERLHNGETYTFDTNDV